mgnify:CR=1 FL=1
MDYISKQQLNDRIKSVEDKQILNQIFEFAKHDLVINDKIRFTINSSGVFFDMLLLSDDTIDKINKLVSN